MLQVTKGLTTKLTIPVDYINNVDGEKTRDAFAWDAGDEILVTLKHKKTILGYEATTSEGGAIVFKLSGAEALNKYEVAITFTRGGVSYKCYVGTLQIVDKATPDFNTLNGVYIYADDDTIKFIKAYDGERFVNLAELNAARIQAQQNGGGGGASLKNVTYAELKAMRDGGQLVAGQSYRITDYETRTTQADTSAAGHNFDVIVTALDAHTLSEDAHAIQHDGDEYFSGSNLAAWRLRYCLDNDVDRFAWADGDTPARWRVVVDGDPWDYVRAKSYDNDGDEYPYAWAYDDDGEIDYGDIMYTKNELPAVGDIALQEGEQYEITSVTPPQEGNGKGVIYFMRDEFGNECPYDFKNITFTIIERDDPVYTFASIFSDSIYDTTHIVRECTNNIIKPCFDGTKQVLNRIIIYDYAHNCYIGYDCSDITLRSFNRGGAESVKIADNCNRIDLYKGAEFINIGAECDNITLDPELYARHIDICSATSNIVLDCAEETTPFNRVQNVVITHGVGVGGDEDNPKTITIPHAGVSYTTTIGVSEDTKINV